MRLKISSILVIVDYQGRVKTQSNFQAKKTYFFLLIEAAVRSCSSE